MRLKSALRRGVAAAVIAGIVVSSGIPAYAKTWNIADGDITVKGASDESGNYNNVKQGEKDFEKDEGETVITGESDKNTVTIDTSEGNVDVTFDDLKIDVSGKAEGDGSSKTEGDVSDETEGTSAMTAQSMRQSCRRHRGEGHHDAAIELERRQCELKNGNESPADIRTTTTPKAPPRRGGEGGAQASAAATKAVAGNIEITGGTVEAVGGEVLPVSAAVCTARARHRDFRRQGVGHGRQLQRP